VVFDTDLLSTSLYADHYYGVRLDWLETAIVAPRERLYLLCDIDLAWIPDPVRDRGEHRSQLHRMFAQALQARGLPHVLIQGAGQARLELALVAAHRFLAEP
jgi:nicotinamide riboside kinase